MTVLTAAADPENEKTNLDDLIGDGPKATPSQIRAAGKALEALDPKLELERMFSLDEQVKVFKSVLDGIYNGSGAARAAMTKIYKDSIPLYASQQGITEVVSFAPPPPEEITDETKQEESK